MSKRGGWIPFPGAAIAAALSVAGCIDPVGTIGCPGDCTPLPPSSCGNGVVDPGETCDPPGGCPPSCDDGNACTKDTQSGTAVACNQRCAHARIDLCAGGDGCCPSGCTSASDADCSASCGNGAVDAGETCDPAASCPASCDDGNACTTDVMTGSPANCNVACSRTPITACKAADGCCPLGCDKATDADCSASCGNGTVEAGETCDPPASCPTSCDDGNACTLDTRTGSPTTCNVACSSAAITTCKAGDGCCPSGCTKASDGDCSASCGNGVREAGETCDPPSSCPSGCDDGNACTIDTRTGQAATCNVACSSTSITTCKAGDGCCPSGCTSASDGDCSASCGNGIVETGETCDPPSSCPSSCDDGNACTIDKLTGIASSCTVACSSTSITACRNGDGCCPSGCSSTTDSDCSASCGNGMIDMGETCDPPSTCPSSCNDGNACTLDKLTGMASSCNVACSSTAITACTSADGCCPSGCNATNDGDCSPVCGNGVKESGETCDPKSTCPSTCNDGNACTADRLMGMSATCDAVCSTTAITACTAGDGCCPPGCNKVNDGDCPAVCGNGVVEPGETCDPSTDCPSSCDDGNVCTTDVKTGMASTCNVACAPTAITICTGGDGCCPPACNGTNDSDCSPTCGNGVKEAGETCDPASTCPTSCNDGNACTTDRLTGMSASCNVACSSTAITLCVNGDGCCPSGCNAVNDSNCTPRCGNGVVESGETCDQPSTCPTSCDDGNACTTDARTGMSSTCNVVCTSTAITQCVGGDGCCPSACNANNDANCTPKCGNGVVESGETCDQPSTCPTSCDDGNACTTDRMTGGSSTCNVACSSTTITACTNNDGCCPSGCNSTNDNNCSVSCGNSVIEAGETCDPPSSCPTACNDGNACTIDTKTGQASTCNVACSATSITACTHSDGCCPSGCNMTNDNNCSATCGNGVVETGETCDPTTTCPASCDDGKACTLDKKTGLASTCNVACSSTTITACTSNDGCCPSGCTSTNDNDCTGGTIDCRVAASWPATWVMLEDQVLALTNMHRMNGYTCRGTYFGPRAALVMNAQLRQAARCHSMDMGKNNFQSHTGSNGSTVLQRITAAGYSNPRTWGENIAWGQTTASAAVQAWMTSTTGHCENIMNINYKDIGIGYYFDNPDTYKHYWTQDFAAK